MEKALEELTEAKAECKKILGEVSIEIDKLKGSKVAEDAIKDPTSETTTSGVVQSACEAAEEDL